MIYSMLYIVGLAFVQNVAFTLVSRSRNRDNFKYHMFCAIASNSVWFLTFRELVLNDMTWVFFIPYIVGTVCGSLFGAKVAMNIEKKIGALSDG